MTDERIKELYETVKPIAELVEQNKKRTDALIHDIEFGGEVTDDEWGVISDLSSNLLDLSLSGGATNVNALTRIARVSTLQGSENMKPKIMWSPDDGKVYIVTEYEDRGNNRYTAIVKHDVTAEFSVIVENMPRDDIRVMLGE